MAYIDPTTGQEVLTEEEKRQRELEAEAMAPNTVQPSAPVTPQSLGVNYSLAPQPQPGRLQAPVESVAPIPLNASANGAGAANGKRYAADLNNPTGLGWNGKTWNSYNSPEEGVQATKDQLGRYLSGQGPMMGRAPTVDNITSMWTTGGKTPASQVQGGEYSKAIATELQKSGIQMGPNGEIPNTPEAQTAITRAMVTRETAPQHQARFAGALGLPGAQTTPVSPQQLAQQPVQQPAAKPTSQGGIEAYQAAQDDPQALMKLHYDESQPEFIRQRAGDRVYDLLDSKRKEQEATKMLPQMGPAEIAKTLTQKSTGNSIGDWAQYLLYKHVGLTDLANEKGDQLGIGHKWSVASDAEGKNAMIKYSASGKPLEGVDSTTGQPLDQKQLLAFASDAAGKLNIVGGSYINDATKEVGRLVTDEKTGRSYIQTDSGRKPMSGFRPQASGGSLADQLAAQQQKANVNLQYAAPTAAATAGGKVVGETAATYGTPIQQPQQLPIPGVPQVQAGQTPQVAQAPAQMAAPAVATAQVPAQMAAPAPAASPANLAANMKIGTEERQDYVTKAKPEIVEKAEIGRTVSGIRKQQLDIILKNPELAGMLNGQGGQSGEVGNIVRDLVSGNFKEQTDLSQRIGNLNLSQTQKNALYELSGLQSQVLPTTLKANAGPGAISEAEHKINREANVDVTRVPLYSGLTLMSRDQYQKDLSAYRSDWADSTGQQTRAGESRAWAAEKKKMEDVYNNIYKARAEYISKYGSTPGAVVDAFKYYPNPQYNPDARKFEYSGYSAKVANGLKRPAIDSFNK